MIQTMCRQALWVGRVLGTAGDHMIWMYEMLKIPDPGIRTAPDRHTFQLEELMRHGSSGRLRDGAPEPGA